MTNNDFKQLKSYNEILNKAKEIGKYDVLNGFYYLINPTYRRGIMLNVYQIDEEKLNNLLEISEFNKEGDDEF